MNDFERELSTALRREEQYLDAAIVKRIAAARHRAVSATPVSWIRRVWAPVIGAAVLAGAAGIALLPPEPVFQTNRSASNEEAVENPELYRNLEFYLWLAESDMGRHG